MKRIVKFQSKIVNSFDDFIEFDKKASNVFVIVTYQKDSNKKESFNVISLLDIDNYDKHLKNNKQELSKIINSKTSYILNTKVNTDFIDDFLYTLENKLKPMLPIKYINKHKYEINQFEIQILIGSLVLRIDI